MTELDDRFAERAAYERRRRLRRVVVAVLALIVVGALVWIVMFSSVLAVRRVAVDGETTLRESQVRQVADVRIGQPLARVDLSAIEARVASMERIQSVTVSRSWFHAVRITVVERTPVAWLTDAGVIRGLDRYGIDFRTYDKAPTGLLKAEVTATDPRRRQQTLEAVAAVVQLIEDDDRALRKQVQAVSAATKDSIELNLTKGRTVLWGSRGDASHKLTVLRALLRIDAKRYDVSAPDQPTTTG
ncbi:cell division protein FtsQ/DivIB [Aeromicrobium sp. 9AM]|uniref:cell division protein FtsQ/DivIB n=1 Tax=Aeromicrobium sp. 9AM TaxID=2653126 RepID=UPI0012F24CC6|nr:FtsQ-type POTRA domain-containing protein [Aeromicrobium sp. 9AM]VXC01692.1 Cell division protein FtsQ [Aeromicrobium sp. 9AM]